MTRSPVTSTPRPTSFTDRILRWRTHPIEFLAEQVILENGKPLGEQWDDWQREDFEGIISHKNSMLLRPRGHSKTSDCGSLIVWALICGRPGLQIYSAAADQGQAGLLLKDVIDKFQASPLLRPLIKTTANSVTVTATGSTYRTLASDAPSAFGLRPDYLLVDELAEWPASDEKLWHALWSSTGKRRDAKTIVISSPGGELLARLRDMALTESSWFVSERPQCASWIDAGWLDQQRKSLPDHVYKRLHEGLWTLGEGQYLTRAEVQRIFVEALPHSPVVAYTIGIDLGYKRDRAVLAVCALRADSLVMIDELYVYTPSKHEPVDLTEVESDAVKLAQAYQATLICDPYQAILMSQRMRQQGLVVIDHAVTQESRKKLFGRLLDVVRNNQLRSFPHEVFERELLGLQVEERGGGWRVDHAPGQHDDCVFAVGLGLVGLELVPDPVTLGSYESDIIGNMFDAGGGL